MPGHEEGYQEVVAAPDSPESRKCKTLGPTLEEWGIRERSQNLQRPQLPCLLTPGEQEVALLGAGATLKGADLSDFRASRGAHSPGKTPGLDHWLPTF